MDDSVKKVTNKIISIFERRKAQIYASALLYMAKAIQSFRIKQRNNVFWTNRSGLAMDLMFTYPIKKNTIIGWGMAHAVDYGVYLELSNDGSHEAIRKIINIYFPLFISDVKKLYSDTA